jgi:peptide subunit release factor 1 (eRF1)
MGQVEELLITAVPQQIGNADVANDLVTKAQQTSARIRFVEDPALLADVGGVGALLRFRI